MSKLTKYYGTKVKKGDYIFREGDEADALYMIHKGKVEINRRSGEKLQVLGEGEFIGEMAIINSKPRSANALAIEDCELIRMDSESFYKSIHDNRDFSVNVVQFLSDRLRETDDLVSVMSRRSEKQALFTEMLFEMVANPKTDKTGRWALLSKKDFVTRIQVRQSYNENMINSMINDLELEEKIKLQKTASGDEWIACKIK